MRIIFSLIGYLCVATVISATVGLAYMWNSERMDDEKVFRMFAILYDIDVDQVAQDDDETAQELDAPPEEASSKDTQLQREVVMRDFEVQLSTLKTSRQEFDYYYQRIRTATDRFDRLAVDLEKRLTEEGELSTKESVDKVVRDLMAIDPKIAKDLLRRTLSQEEGVKDVILLMNAMQPRKLANILKQFRTPEELDDLHMIHQVQMNGGPRKSVLDDAMQEIQTMKQGR